MTLYGSKIDSFDTKRLHLIMSNVYYGAVTKIFVSHRNNLDVHVTEFDADENIYPTQSGLNGSCLR